MSTTVEAKAPLQWEGASLDHQVVHAGRGAIRLDEPADQLSVEARYAQAPATWTSASGTVEHYDGNSGAMQLDMVWGDSGWLPDSAGWTGIWA